MARNVTRNDNGVLRVRFTDPRRSIGAVVVARYDGGMSRAQRFGSADSTQYSQSLLPLEFGVPDGQRITSLDVSWPGGRREVLIVPADSDEVRLERGPV